MTTDAFRAGAVRPAGGDLPLPLLTLDMARYRANRDSLLAYGRAHGALLAPHVKTAMIPELATDFVAAGGWGVTVADVRQAAAMIAGGVSRLVLANEVGGRYGARHFARLVAAHPTIELITFVDSPEAVAALDAALAEVAPSRTVPVLLEVGIGRAGVRDLPSARRVLDALGTSERAGRIRVAGVAAYEGAATVADRAETLRRVDALLSFAAEALGAVRERVGEVRPLIASAGGSLYFDRVVAILGAAVRADPRCDLVLRPGAILYGDHGIYETGIAALDERGGFKLDGVAAQDAFRPVLQVFAEVLSRPEPGLAICGMGMRNVSYDAGLPRALQLYRDGAPIAADLSGVAVQRLNDQHAFVGLGDADIRVGDVVAFGISHPCTCFHLWREVQVLDAEGRISGSLTTRFG